MIVRAFRKVLYSLMALWLIGSWSVAATARDARFDYSPYGRILDQYSRPGVRIDGLTVTAVDYGALAAASKKPDSDYSLLLKALERFNPDTLEGREEKMAFWINVYNIAAMKMIVDHYPVDSIRSRAINWLGLPWSIKIITVGGREYSLGQIENERLLDAFRDLRIHFAINCASVSCVNLAPKPYRGGTLSRQLDDQGRLFLADPQKGLRLERSGKVIYLSQIFKFDRRRFDGIAGGALGFVAPYLPPADRAFLKQEAVTIEYLDYNWKTNDIKRSQ